MEAMLFPVPSRKVQSNQTPVYPIPRVLGTKKRSEDCERTETAH